ncbi:MAG: hypothetical protein FJ109_08545 [Deltaproteobacteria bacterium]|nr:hypothetical protein [Deltaproteobacteria bacterium]
MSRMARLAIVPAGLLLTLWGCGGGTVVVGGDVPDGVADAPPESNAPAEVAAELSPEHSVPEVWDGRGLDGFETQGPAPGEAGWPCAAPSDCLEGFCIVTAAGKQCTQSCVEDCPFGWKCVEYTPDQPDELFVCVPDNLALCRPCLTNQDCLSNESATGQKCLPYGPAGSFCGAPCTGEGECPGGYSCQETEDVTGAAVTQCVREDGECPCSQYAADQGAKTECAVQSDWGSCPGMRKCLAQGLTACDAQVPVQETCNDEDDDCDGDVDEELGGGACQVVSRFGACPGLDVCTDGKLTCEGKEPKAEVCDGEDNDCDGEVDDGFPDTDGDGKADCLESDKDGDDVVDGLDNCPAKYNPGQEDTDFDGQGDACDLDDDNDMSPDAKDCAPLDPNSYPGADEVCDGADNDCNLLVDEGFADTDADGWKDCVDEDDDGDGTPDGEDCAPLVAGNHPGAVETCDGADNDCDGKADEGFADSDQDGMPDCVDGDDDGDGHDDGSDNCPKVANPGQEDQDQDGLGNACDLDKDGDSIPDAVDNCPLVKNPVQSDVDKDGQGDACDDDDDGDGLGDGKDNCPLVANPGQEDGDQDGTGDACENDKDGDGTPDAQDCAPLDPATHPGAPEVCDGVDNDCDLLQDEGFADKDADGLKDCVDPDDDGDGDPDETDCAPLDPAVHQGAKESCNGQDDDCDGETDEGIGQLACGKGECFHVVETCLGGVPQVCDPLQGVKIETCDGKDNDCDGLADEDLGKTSCGLGVCYHTASNCVNGKPVKCDPLDGSGPEECDGLDNDCDGKVDEELGQVECGLGVCAQTMPACLGGVAQKCDPFKGAKKEICDGADNDCDGQTDEGLGQTTCGKGTCLHTVANCIDGLPQTCNPLEGAEAETCDATDNDCDGLVDEELGQITCGVGVCLHSVKACDNGIPGVCDPLAGAKVETCGDKLDNDCNGIVDAQCGDDQKGTCLGSLCCDQPCTGVCVACDLPGKAGKCTAIAAGTDPDDECGGYHCSGGKAVFPGASTCFGSCTEEEAVLQCKSGFHCDQGVCTADLPAGAACDEDSDCKSGLCGLDFDGDASVCAATKTHCVDEAGGVTTQYADGEVFCGAGDGYRVCTAGGWNPASPDSPVLCGAGLCDGGCGYVTDEDNLCVSGLALGVDGGCELEDLGLGVTCQDCGDLTALPGACAAGLAACSKACGADCLSGETVDSGQDVCWANADGEAYDRVDACALQGQQCVFADDGHASDKLVKDCGAFDCYGAGLCHTDCGGDNDKCNTGYFCSAGKCLSSQGLLPWAVSGAYLVLTKIDNTYFSSTDCPDNFFGKDEATVSGVPFRVGPYKVGSNLAGLPPNAVVPAPYQSWTVKNTYMVFPGGRCSGQPLQVTYNYVDGSSAATGQANIPWDCNNGGSWSGSNFQIYGQGNYGGPCCDYWYMGKFTNPNPGKAVKSLKVYYYDGCGGSYNGQMWAMSID